MPNETCNWVIEWRVRASPIIFVRQFEANKEKRLNHDNENKICRGSDLAGESCAELSHDWRNDFTAFLSHKLCDYDENEFERLLGIATVCTTFQRRRNDELLLQKCNQQLPFHNVHLTDVSTDCNNKFHTFLRNVLEWAFLVAKLDHNGVKHVIIVEWWWHGWNRLTASWSSIQVTSLTDHPIAFHFLL